MEINKIDAELQAKQEAQKRFEQKREIEYALNQLGLTLEEMASFAHEHPQYDIPNQIKNYKSLTSFKRKMLGVIISAWKNKKKGEMTREADRQAKEVMQYIMAAPEQQGDLRVLCGYPTLLTRTNPFFPLKRGKERKYLQNYIITAAGWGTIKFTGPQLSIYDEDILLACLSVMQKEHNSSIESGRLKTDFAYEYYDDDDTIKTALVENDSEGYYVLGENELKYTQSETWTYKGPISEIMNILGKSKKRGKSTYEAIKNSLKRLATSGFELNIKDKKEFFANIICNYVWDENEKIISVTINPFFFKMYLEKRLTWIDIKERKQLKGDIAKALHRFIKSQNRSGFDGNLLTLADVLNISREHPKKEIRRMIRDAIAELGKYKIITEDSQIKKNDIVHLALA